MTGFVHQPNEYGGLSDDPFVVLIVKDRPDETDLGDHDGTYHGGVTAGLCGIKSSVLSALPGVSSDKVFLKVSQIGETSVNFLGIGVPKGSAARIATLTIDAMTIQYDETEAQTGLHIWDNGVKKVVRDYPANEHFAWPVGVQPRVAQHDQVCVSGWRGQNERMETHCGPYHRNNVIHYDGAAEGKNEAGAKVAVIDIEGLNLRGMSGGPVFVRNDDETTVNVVGTLKGSPDPDCDCEEKLTFTTISELQLRLHQQYGPLVVGC